MTDIAVLQFPGSNCEYETVAALTSVGIKIDLVPWNAPADNLDRYKGYVLPGGFSFQDRIRAGVVSAKLPIMQAIKNYAKEGKPVLGICNGCQMLAELGILPDFQEHIPLEMSLAPNMKDGSFHGFVCDWVYVKVKNPKNSVFTRLFTDEDVIPIPINHGEGNFKFYDDDQIKEGTQTRLVYCDENGCVDEAYPINPNGASLNTAGLCNRAGNVMAIMPHPERAFSWFHVPSYLHHDHAKNRRDGVLTEGPWRPLFVSLAESIYG